MVISISGIHGVGVFLPILLCPACRKICALGPSESSNPSIQLCRSLHVVRTIHNRWILPAFLWGCGRCGGIRTLLPALPIVSKRGAGRATSFPLRILLGDTPRRSTLSSVVLSSHAGCWMVIPGMGGTGDLVCSRRDRVDENSERSGEGLARLTC